MSRLIGLDYGVKRVGVAVTDPMQMVASPLKTVCADVIISFLKDYFSKEPVEAVVVGWPLQLNGLEGFATRLVTQFIRLLKRYFPSIPIFSYDERFTSIMARQSLIIGGFTKRQRRDKSRLDAISASLTLRSFMDNKEWKQRNQ